MNKNPSVNGIDDSADRSISNHRSPSPAPPDATEPSSIAEQVSVAPRPINVPALQRMVALQHQGPLPWVQLRNAVYNNIVFRKMVGRIAPEAANGGLVRVYDRDGAIFGTGLLNTQSQIALRMLCHNTQSVDEEFLPTRLQNAVELRHQTLQLAKIATAYRIVHAEGDGLPGLIVDRLGDYAVVELFALAMYLRRDRIAQTLLRLLNLKEVLIRADEKIQNAEGFRLENAFGPAGRHANLDAPTRLSTIITENTLRFQVDLTNGHKTGFFCDQRDNRLALTHFCHNAHVLDVCCYTGGFGIYAAKLGQASNVTAVDLDEESLALARRNANLNQIAPAVYQMVHADAFAYLRQMKQNIRSYDVLVLDPPKLVPTRLDFAEGRQKYFDLNKLALALVRPGGLLLTCSCSGLVDIAEFTSIIRGAARSAQRRVQILNQTGPGMDHPVATDYLEGSYLKCLWCRVF
ncbi:MAG: class I SAM-dependent rRNA methyltransferase [Phycisphaerae bacterium]|nr:class I SAM-dependent rRNA methyltransferase [Phycisphaerae bacterium]